MIDLDRVTVTYPGAESPTLRDVTLHVPEGELCLVTGHTGVGKSTLLATINGIFPHFTGGHLAGSVRVDGRDTSTHPPRELADVVGVVSQDPLAGFVTDTVEEELAYGMEQLAIPTETMRKRVEETLDLLGIAELRSRPMRTLSGGQQQRVAMGSVLTCHPRVLVLDEPTSALDPNAAEDVLAAITRLVHDLGVTVLIAEHRLERVAQYADRAIHVHRDGTVVDGTPAEVLAWSPVAPPIVRLGRMVGWDPLPLSVRDARRSAAALRDRLEGQRPPTDARRPVGDVVVTATRVTVRYGGIVAVREVDLQLRTGEIVALMGRNGSGKSSLMWALQGSGPRAGGSVAAAGRTGTPDHVPADTKSLGAKDARRRVGLVPQTPSDLLYLSTVDAECEQADVDAGAAAGSCAALLHRLVGDIDGGHHPRDLSEGQRLALVLAIQLTAAPPTMLLDEPTRGLDYDAKARLTEVLGDLAADGRAIMVSTHDVEFVANVADRVVVMAQGEVVADGPTADVVVASPTFAPQVAKVLAPQSWLTVEQVAAALDEETP